MSPDDRDPYSLARLRMVRQLAAGGIYAGSVLDAMSRVRRDLFVSDALRYRAYDDTALPIGFNQTISRPLTVARMIQAIDLKKTDRVFEIGAGSGYQCALLAEIAAQVVSSEKIQGLFQRAREVLLFRLGYRNISLVHNDDFLSVEGSFDAIIVAAGASELPTGLFQKLNQGGRLIIPVEGGRGQVIRRYVRNGDAIIEDDLGAAEFVPLIAAND